MPTVAAKQRRWTISLGRQREFDVQTARSRVAAIKGAIAARNQQTPTVTRNCVDRNVVGEVKGLEQRILHPALNVEHVKRLGKDVATVWRHERPTRHFIDTYARGPSTLKLQL